MRPMKCSGVEWIGKIPSDWNVVNLKYLGFTKSGLGNKKPDDFGHGYQFISYKNIYSHFSIIEEYSDLVDSTEIERQNFSVYRGDAFFTGSSETIEELGMASMCLRDLPNATFNGFSIRFRPYSLVDYHPEYMMYYFRSFAAREHLVRNDNSITRANLSQRLLNMLPVLIPPHKKQIKLADFLTHKVTLIDNIIEKTKQSIEEYKKLKQSIITEAVTKGLNPDVKMKDSGIEWIGEIPEHWSVSKLNKFVFINNGKDNIEKDGDIPVYGSGGIFGRTNESLYEGESVLLGRKGTIDKPRFVQGPFWTVDTVFYTVPKNNTDMRFFYYLSNTIQFDLYKSGSILPSMTQSTLNEIMLPCPSIEAQRDIAKYLDNKCELIDFFLKQKDKLILELESYKKSLIYEVVTGKKEIT